MHNILHQNPLVILQYDLGLYEKMKGDCRLEYSSPDLLDSIEGNVRKSSFPLCIDKLGHSVYWRNPYRINNWYAGSANTF